MLQLSDVLCLSPESLYRCCRYQQIGPHDLDGEVTVQTKVPNRIDHGESATTQFRQYVVVASECSLQQLGSLGVRSVSVGKGHATFRAELCVGRQGVRAIGA